MKTTARSILSAAIALSLAAFTTVSFLILGAAAPATVLGFSLLAVYGVAEIAILAYAPRPTVRVSLAPLPAPRRVEPARVRVPAVVEFPACATRRVA